MRSVRHHSQAVLDSEGGPFMQLADIAAESCASSVNSC
jgi:hypothetical protein